MILREFSGTLTLQKLIAYARLMRFHKPIGIALLLWPTLWALWIARQGIPDIKILIIFILGTIIMRSAGCVINDYADRNFDAHVARTRERPLATRQISPKEALVLFAILCLLALLLVLQLNRLTMALSVVALLLASIYPFTKRYTYWPQLFLGAAFAWSVPMAFAAQLNTVPSVTWLIYGIALLWPLYYDTLYAMADKEDDVKIGIKSTAILFGKHVRWILSILQAIILLLLVVVGFYFSLNLYYYLGLIGAVACLFYQQHLMRKGDAQSYFKAFLNNNWLGLLVFMGIALNYFLS